VARAFRVVERHLSVDIAILDVDGIPDGLAVPPIVDEAYTPRVGDEVGVAGYAHGSVLIRRNKEAVRFGPILQRGIVAALAPYEVATPDVALLDLIAGPAASGSPVFDTTTGHIFGMLFEGQIGKSAAVSMAPADLPKGRRCCRCASYDVTTPCGGGSTADFNTRLSTRCYDDAVVLRKSLGPRSSGG
jgi:trypsin-like peptidase